MLVLTKFCYFCLTSHKEWLDLENDVQAGSVLGFGKKLGSIVEVHMEE